jgi:hypothetical protein
MLLSRLTGSIDRWESRRRLGCHSPKEAETMTLINLIPGMAFGQGIDGLTEQRRAPAIAFDGETDNSGGAIVDSRMTIIESQDSLMEALDLSVSASVRYGFVEGDAKFETGPRTNN